MAISHDEVVGVFEKVCGTKVQKHRPTGAVVNPKDLPDLVGEVKKQYQGRPVDRSVPGEVGPADHALGIITGDVRPRQGTPERTMVKGNKDAPVDASYRDWAARNPRRGRP